MMGEGERREPGGGESPLEDVLKKLGDHLNAGGFFQTAVTDSGGALGATSGDELSIETALDGFRLIKLLGHGGMGEVWEAEELAIGRRVALKLLHPHIEFSSKGIERFEREAQAGGKLSHPGIVQVLSVGESDGRHYMAQELVSGSITLADSLAGYREEDELPGDYYQRIAVLFVRIGRALAHVHEQGVVHRDIKPSNILITPDDQPKVADFGLAMMEDSLSLSRTGEFMGTPFYMSPEQAATRRMGIDHRTDIFSLGATLYEALTLERPFTGDTSQQVFQQILLMDPPAPKDLRSRVPQDLATICLKAMEKVPGKRYSTMTIFAEDLERYLSDRPIMAKPPTAIQRAVKWSRRNPTKSVAGVTGFIALALVSFLLVQNLEQKRSLGKVLILTEILVTQQKPENNLGKKRPLSEIVSEELKTFDKSDLSRIATVINSMANTLWQQGDWDESHNLWLAIADNYARCYGETSMEYHRAMGWVGLYEFKFGDVHEAVRIQEEALQCFREELGPTHDRPLQIQLNYGQALWKAGRKEEGLDNLRQSYEQRLIICKTSEAPNTHSLALSVSALGNVLRGIGETAEAEAVFIVGFDFFADEYPDSPTSIWMNFDYADLMDVKGDRDKATRLLIDSLERCGRVLPGHPDLEVREAEFEQRNHEASLVMARARVERSPSSAEARDVLAWNLLANSKYDEAVDESKTALDLASESEREKFQGILGRLRAMTEKARVVQGG